MRKNKNLLLLVTSAMLAALTCVATMIIQIPSKTNGYTNLGDAFVLLSGWLLGPVYGGLASGIGSMLADILSGYAHYALPTFLIKGLIGVVAGLASRFIIVKYNHKPLFKITGLVASGVIAEIIMCTGYFLCEWLFKGSAAIAVTGIPGNIVQGVIGLIVGTVLMLIISNLKIFKFYE